MGCPMFERKYVPESPTKYPFQSLYRPWSWILSSFVNVAIFAALLVLLYALAKRASRRRRSKQEKFTYRKVSCEAPKKTESLIPVLVTGGSGCLGQCLVKHLLEEGRYEVHSLDLFIPDNMIPGVASYIKADITNGDDVQFAFKDTNPQVVFHVAGLLPSVKSSDADLFKVNAIGTKFIVEACKHFNVRRLIYTSTCDVLMSKDKRQVLDLANESSPYPEQPLNAYCASKIEGEKLVLSANGNNLATCVLRCSIIGSPHSAMFNALLTNQAYYIGDGTNRQCLVDVNACAAGHVLADCGLRERRKSVAGQVYHLAGDVYVLKDLLGYQVDESGYTIWGYPPPGSIPKWIVSFAAFFNILVFTLVGFCPISVYFDSHTVDFFSRSYTFSGSKAKQELGWGDHPPWQDVVLDIVEDYERSKKCK